MIPTTPATTGPVRLATKLMASGMPEEEVEKLDRAGLMENWARTVLEGKDKPAPVVPTAMGYDPAIEKERLEFEKRKFELEMKKMELQAQMMAEEKAERVRREEIEAKRKVKALEALAKFHRTEVKCWSRGK